MQRARPWRTLSLLLHRQLVVQTSRATATRTSTPTAWSVSASRSSVIHQYLPPAMRCVKSAHPVKRPEHRCFGSHHLRSSAKHLRQRAELRRHSHSSTHPSPWPASPDAKTPTSAKRSWLRWARDASIIARICPPETRSLANSRNASLIRLRPSQLERDTTRMTPPPYWLPNFVTASGPEKKRTSSTPSAGRFRNSSTAP
jgi:hypothetical protein